VKPLSDAASSHSSDRVASRDTSQSKKGHSQQTDSESRVGGTGHSSEPSNSAVVDHRCCRLSKLILELLLVTAAAVTCRPTVG